MRRHGDLPDRHDVSYGASQMQHISGQRMLHNATMDTFPGRLDSYYNQEAHPYRSAKPDGQWQWDRDGPKPSNQMPSHPYSDGQRANVTSSNYQGQMLDPSLGIENQVSRDARGLPYEHEIGIGHEGSQSVLTFEGLEQKFLEEIMKLTKELNDAEDAEITRHKEKVKEINTRYQEKLSALRNQHADRRGEFLRKEAQARRNQYEQVGMSQNSSSNLQEAHFGGGTALAAAGHSHHLYTSGQLQSTRDQPLFLGSGRNPGAKDRIAYPPTCAYNTGPPRFY